MSAGTLHSAIKARLRHVPDVCLHIGNGGAALPKRLGCIQTGTCKQRITVLVMLYRNMQFSRSCVRPTECAQGTNSSKLLISAAVSTSPIGNLRLPITFRQCSSCHQLFSTCPNKNPIGDLSIAFQQCSGCHGAGTQIPSLDGQDCAQLCNMVLVAHKLRICMLSHLCAHSDAFQRRLATQGPALPTSPQTLRV